MKTATVSAPRTKTDTRLVGALNQILADSYALMALTHMAHWNVEGPHFFALHHAFQEQYEDLFKAVDDIAERVRALDAYAIGGLSALARQADLEEFEAPMPDHHYLSHLISAHEKAIKDARQARDIAGELNDLESQDLMIARLTEHQKTVWMLKSMLKQ